MAATPSPSTPSWVQGMPGPPPALAAPFSRKGAADANTPACRANSQKTSRQPLASSTAPPNRGPSTVAMPQMKVTEANTRARCRSGNISAMATMAKPEIQPEPRPWMRRPIRKVATSGASALITQPAAIRAPAAAVAPRRPKISRHSAENSRPPGSRRPGTPPSPS